MGTSYFAVPILKSLYQNGYPISVVYTQPPKKSNRGQKLNKSAINLFCENISLEVRTPQFLKNNNEEELYLKDLKPDIILVVSYGQIIPINLLNIPKKGFLNVHASLLPKWRGAAPIQRSIMNLDKETGISIMKIVEELDAGPIMSQDKIKINENVDSFILSELLSKLGAKSIITAIKKIENNEANFHEQNNKEATYAKKISKKEAEINWNQNAKIILAKINALNPNPGAWFKYKNERYKVWKANLAKGLGEPGKVLDGKLKICCQENAINIIKIQKEGKSIQDIDQFLLGNKIKEGEILV